MSTTLELLKTMLKTNINNGTPARTRQRRWISLAATALLWVAVGGAAQAETFYTVPQLLSEHFGTSERVSFVKVELDAGKRARIERRLGRSLAKANYTFYVATSGSTVDGYALFDEERGQHELISFATFFDGRGEITRVEVVAYREPYGDGIRGQRFRKQFVGRRAGSGFAPNKDIDAVSGATISSRSMCAGVKRASVLLEETVLKRKTVVASR